MIARLLNSALSSVFAVLAFAWRSWLAFLALVYASNALRFVCVGLVLAAWAVLLIHNFVGGMHTVPIAGMAIYGLLCEIPRPRVPRLWPTSRTLQRVEMAFEARLDGTVNARAASPYVSETANGLAHAFVVAAFTWRWGYACWLATLVAMTTLWAYGVGKARSAARAGKLAG